MSQTTTPAAQAESLPVIPHFELATQWQLIKNDVEAAVKDVLNNHQYTGGPAVQRFEENLGRFVGAHAVAVSSGTDAILAALMSLGIKRGHEVITTPFTFFATAGCISRAGAKPVFVDIDPTTYLMSIPEIPHVVTRNTRAILPVHLYGQMMDTTTLLEFADAHHVEVIEDAAQCIGARDLKGAQIAQNSRCACLSFYPTKNLGACGDAGAIITRDEKLAARFRQCRQHGEVSRYHHEFVGGNFRLDAIQCAILDVKLKYINQWNERRRAIAAYYTKRFRGTEVRPPVEIAGSRHVYHQYVVRTSRRDQLRDYLTKNGVGCNVFYPKCLHLQQCFAELGYKQGQFPVAEKAAKEVLALPVYPELTDEQIERIANTVLSFYKK